MEQVRQLIERLNDIKTKPQSGMNILSELQELMDMAPKALDEVLQAEMTLDQQNALLTLYERGGAA